jgi:Tol biopolymer transport system component
MVHLLDICSQKRQEAMLSRNDDTKRRTERLRTITGMTLAILLVTSVFALTGFATMPPASATFPGENGKIAFERQGGIYTMDADGSNELLLTTSGNEPSWSPDGAKIVFSSIRDGDREIYVMNSDGTGQTRLTNHSGFDGSPTWSPNGEKIAFTRGLEPSEIYVMDSDGSSPTSLTSDLSLSSSNPDWSPDGTKIVFYGTLNEEGLIVMNADGTGKTLLTSPVGLAPPNPSWSPDGKKIAFERMSFGDPDATHDIYVINADGTNLTRLTKTPIPGGSSILNYDLEPTWSPDGTKIAFVTNRDGNDEIYIMKADGTEQTNFANMLDTTGRSPDWGVQPATKQLTINSIDKSGNALNGMWATIRTPDGTMLKSGFTPLTFIGNPGIEYKVSVANYDGKTFEHWQDDESTSKSRVITLTSDTTLTAIYNSAGTVRGFTSLDVSSGRHVLTVNAVSLDDGRTLHMWTVVTSFHSTYEGGPERHIVYMHNYKDIVFDHWEDGSTDSIRTLDLNGSKEITAYYHTG